MAQVEYCDDCKRMKGIACACDLTFAEKAKGIGFGMDGWAPNSQPIQMPDNYPKGGKLSKHKPAGL